MMSLTKEQKHRIKKMNIQKNEINQNNVVKRRGKVNEKKQKVSDMIFCFALYINEYKVSK